MQCIYVNPNLPIHPTLPFPTVSTDTENQRFIRIKFSAWVLPHALHACATPARQAHIIAENDSQHRGNPDQSPSGVGGEREDFLEEAALTEA